MPTYPWQSQQRVRMDASDRRHQILDAATELISVRGFWGVTLRDVATVCGITEAGVLHHVKSKAGLLIALLERRDEVDMLSLANSLHISLSDLEAPTPPVGLREMCTALVRGNSQQAEIVRLYSVLLAESLDPDHPAHEYFQSREEWVMDLFARGAIVDGAPDPISTAREALAAMDGLQLRWLRALDDFDLEEEWEALADKLLPQGRIAHVSSAD